MNEHYYYAQLNNDGSIITKSDLSGKVNRSDMILLTEEEYYEITFDWKYINNKWIKEV